MFEDSMKYIMDGGWFDVASLMAIAGCIAIPSFDMATVSWLLFVATTSCMRSWIVLII